MCLSQSQMMVSPGFCFFSLHLKNTGSDVFSFSARERIIVWMSKEVTVYFLKMLLRSQCFYTVVWMDWMNDYSVLFKKNI